MEEILDRRVLIYSSDSEEEPHPLNTSFNDAEHFETPESRTDRRSKGNNMGPNVRNVVHPLILTYHGKSHYNSVFNQRHPLPLQRRNSKTILEERIGSSKR